MRSTTQTSLRSLLNLHTITWHPVSLLFRQGVHVSTWGEKRVWIALKQTGKVISRWCSCMAGPGFCCNHIMAVLFKMECAWNMHDLRDPACTSMACTWNASTLPNASLISTYEKKLWVVLIIWKPMMITQTETNVCASAFCWRNFIAFEENSTPTSRCCSSQINWGMLHSSN